MPHTNTTPPEAVSAPATAPKPTPRQLRYLRDLADRLGQTFTYPTTRNAASREIARLKTLARGRQARLDRHEARTERRQLAAEFATELAGATAYREDEIAGYGAHATFHHAPRA